MMNTFLCLLISLFHVTHNIHFLNNGNAPFKAKFATEQNYCINPPDTSWKPAYNFSLPDSSGVFHHLNDYKGKVVVLDFWFTHCPACMWVKPLVEKVEKRYKGKPVVFISISGDKDKDIWKKSLINGEYTFENSVKVYTDGMGFSNPVIENYNVDRYPTLIVIDTKRMSYKISIDPRLDSSKDIHSLINYCLLK